MSVKNNKLFSIMSATECDLYKEILFKVTSMYPGDMYVTLTNTKGLIEIILSYSSKSFNVVDISAYDVVYNGIYGNGRNTLDILLAECGYDYDYDYDSVNGRSILTIKKYGVPFDTSYNKSFKIEELGKEINKNYNNVFCTMFSDAQFLGEIYTFIQFFEELVLNIALYNTSKYVEDLFIYKFLDEEMTEESVLSYAKRGVYVFEFNKEILSENEKIINSVSSKYDLDLIVR